MSNSSVPESTATLILVIFKQIIPEIWRIFKKRFLVTHSFPLKVELQNKFNLVSWIDFLLWSYNKGSRSLITSLLKIIWKNLYYCWIPSNFEVFMLIIAAASLGEKVILLQDSNKIQKLWAHPTNNGTVKTAQPGKKDKGTCGDGHSSTVGGGVRSG